MGRYRGLDTEEGWIQRRLAAIERDLAEQAAARRLVIAATSVQVDLDTITLTGAFATYGLTTIQVPTGFTHAIVNLFTSTGTTFNVGQVGNVGTQPWAGGFNGSAISQGGNGQAVSVNSTMAAKIAVTSSFQVWINAYANGGTRVAGTDNVHLSGSILFIRA